MSRQKMKVDQLVVPAGTPDGYVPSVAAGELVLAAPVAGSGSGSVIGWTSYNPGANTNLDTTSTTVVDVDATNLAVTFTAPTSGRVLVTLSALATQLANGANIRWFVRQGTVTLGLRYMTTARAANWDLPGSASWLITGLAPSEVVTLKWGHSTSSGGTSRIQCGGTIGPAVMTVFAV